MGMGNFDTNRTEPHFLGKSLNTVSSIFSYTAQLQLGIEFKFIKNKAVAYVLMSMGMHG